MGDLNEKLKELAKTTASARCGAGADKRRELGTRQEPSDGGVKSEHGIRPDADGVRGTIPITMVQANRHVPSRMTRSPESGVNWRRGKGGLTNLAHSNHIRDAGSLLRSDDHAEDRHDRERQNTSPTVGGDAVSSRAQSADRSAPLPSRCNGADEFDHWSFCGTAAERSSLRCNCARIYTIRDAGGEDALPVGSFANAKDALCSRESLGGGGFAGAHRRKSFSDEITGRPPSASFPGAFHHDPKEGRSHHVRK
jgi:hypothetical protein